MNKQSILIFLIWSAIAILFMAGISWYDHTFKDPDRGIRKVTVTDVYGNKHTYHLREHQSR